MAYFSWQQAIGAINAALNIDIDSERAPKVRHVNHALRGTNYKVKRSVLSKKNEGIGTGVAAALLPAHDGAWYPILVSGAHFYLLKENGQTDKIINEVDIAKEEVSWIFIKKDAPSTTGVLSFFRHFKGIVAKILLSGMLVNLLSLSLPLFSCFVFDKILGNNIPETLWALAIGLGIILVIDFCVRIIRAGAAESFAQKCEVEIDRSVLNSLFQTASQNLPSMSQFLDKYKQMISSRDFLSSSYLLALTDIPFLAFFLAAIAYTAGSLVLIPVLFGGLVLLASFIAAMPLSDYEKQGQQVGEQKFKHLIDVLSAHEVIAKTHMRKVIERRWRQDAGETTIAQSRARYWRAFCNAMTSSLGFMSYVAMVIGGVYMVDAGTLTSGGLLACTILSSRAMASFSSAVTVFLRHREFRVATEGLQKVLPVNKEDEEEGASVGKLKGDLSLRHVSCKLGASNRPVLNSIDLNIKHGELVGIAGAPGAGKTTLLRLTAGILSPNDGELLFDNIPVSQLTNDDLANNIGYKPQETCLFDGTVEENVRAGRPEFTPLQREYILSASGLKFAFEQGGLNWGTEVGPQGQNISGGQRQLVAIARAIASMPSLLLMDEPTNGLGAELEERFAGYLGSMKGKSTILVSTHSRHILSQCDRILVVGQGRILADGPKEKVLVA